MRTVAGPLVLGLVAFASYSLKTNYAPPPNASSAQEVTAKLRAGEKQKPKRILNSDRNKESNQPCVSLGDSSLQCAIDTFFGKPDPGPVLFDLGKNKASVRFVIATVPDPIHTDLALSFDRFVEAISQGAQEAGYIFDHAVLPWPTPRELSQVLKEDDDSKSASLRLSKLEKENTPGLLIFRNSKVIETAGEKHLFVLLVGETPTAGIHKEQFQRALNIVRTNSVGNPKRVDIIGPTFSGSLYSLRVLEEQANVRCDLTFRVRSGTVMSSSAIYEFRKHALNQDFLSFKDTDAYLIDRFVAFVQKDGLEGYKEENVALISEDETALGSLSSGESAVNQHPDLLRVYFPRGISQLRTAYQDDPVLSSGADKADTPHSKLTLDLDSTGSDDDSVPAYAGRQTAISQEAVMMGIVTVLRTHPHRFLILRATDPKDLLFLTRFFRTNFPQDRIITMGADQLFPRDINDTVFRGVLSLTNYPLLPRQLTDFNPPRPHRVFASTESAGLFNATLAIFREAENGSDAGPLPQAQYFEYTPPVFDNATTEGEKTKIERSAATKEKGPHVGEKKDSSTMGRMEVPPPAAWLTVMGDDGYWPLAILPKPDSARSKFSTLHPHLCKIFFDLGLHPCGVFIPGPPTSLRPMTIIPAPNSASQHSDSSSSTSSSPKPISLEPSAFNQIVIAGLLLFSAAFMYLTWLGNFKSRSTLQQQFSMLTDRTRGVLLGAISLLLTLAFVLMGSPVAGNNLWAPRVVMVGALAVAISTVLNLRARNQPGAALFVAFSSALLASPLLWITRSQHSVNENLVLYRMAWLQSGVSPSLPLLLVCAGFFSWVWFNLKLRSLFDLRRPVLPRGIPLPDADEYDSNEFAHLLTRSLLFWALVGLAIVVIIIQDADPLSLDGTNFDDLYRALFIAGVVFIANSMFIAWCTWKKCRALLLQLDRTPLRWAFRRIEGFSWKPLWGMAGGDLMGAYKPLSRSLEAFAHLRACLNSDQLNGQLAYMQSRAGLVDRDLKYLRGAFGSPTKSARAGHLRQVHDDLTYRIHALQKNLALACSLVWFAVLEEGWRNDARLVTTGRQMCTQSPAKWKGDLDTRGSSESDGPDETCAEHETQATRLAEEFISLTYLNFIHRVLLRLRWLILAATSAYVLLLFSAKLYPFEPHGHIDGLLILLFLGIASVVYTIYTQMHRDATLSHLTKTTPGELGSDFWIQMIGIGAIPVLSLVATQVPALNRFFFLWLKPVIDAVHRS